MVFKDYLSTLPFVLKYALALLLSIDTKLIKMGGLYKTKYLSGGTAPSIQVELSFCSNIQGKLLDYE